jgi:DNA polymerase-1
MKTLCLIDGSAYFYRAYHAIRPLSTKEGIPTNAVFGFTTMLLKVIKDYKPDYVSCVFDTAAKTFRHHMYAEYKANRSEMPEDLQQQIPYIKQVVDALSIHSMELAGYEADDLIGTAVRLFEGKDLQISIISGDKDLMQLVSDEHHVDMIDTMRQVRYTEKEVEEKFGVLPKHMIDYLAMVGDSSDHVPGITGVGPKGAVKFIHEFGSLENLLQSKEKVKGKIGAVLAKDEAQIRLSHKLVSIDCDVPMAIRLEEMACKPAHTTDLSVLFNKLEFHRLLQDLVPTPTTIHSSLDQSRYQAIQTQEALDALLNRLAQEAWFSFDVETTSVKAVDAHLVGMSFALPKDGGQYYLPLGHVTGEVQLARELTLERLKPILENESIGKVGQNLKYDAMVLLSYDIHLKPIIFDTMIASYLSRPGGARHNLDALAMEFLQHQNISFSDVTGKGTQQKLFSEVEIGPATTYACEDAHVAQLLQKPLAEKLRETDLEKVFQTIELPLVPVLAAVETNGVLLDIPKLNNLSREFTQKAEALRQQIFEQAGAEFNLDSPKQLSKILFEKLQYPIIKKTKTGLSTDVGVLETLAKDYDLPKLILAYRGLTKLTSTYVDVLPDLVSPKTGRVHTSFQQAIAATGRLSSTDPNLQNIPIRSEDGKRIREAFIAPSGYQLLSADYSQIELRILAHYSGDLQLAQAYRQNKDIHRVTAAEIFGGPYDLVSDSDRAAAKTINFGIIYGMGAFRLARTLSIPQVEAKTYIDQYFSRYRGIKTFMDETLKEARQTGYVTTLFGRKRFLPDLQSRNIQLKMAAERIAINTPIQGTAADIIKLAMIELHKKIASGEIYAKMILQVHDELLFEIKEEDMDKTGAAIKWVMENAATLSVPLTVNLGAGYNWAEAH